jgi:uncharacterized membrane protein YhfC
MMGTTAMIALLALGAFQIGLWFWIMRRVHLVDRRGSEGET